MRELEELSLGQSHVSSNQERDNPHIYNNHLEYVLMMIGFTVGFGSFWRFPYIVYKNGGGAFFIAYLIVLIVVGIPMLYLQTALGQMHGASLPIILHRIHPALKFVGIAFLCTCLHLSSVYNIILTYFYRFFFTSFMLELPFTNELITQNNFFHKTILQQSSSINEFGSINIVLFVLYIFSLLICYRIIKNGVKESGRIALITLTLPFVTLFVLAVRGSFLSGASDGLKVLFKPKLQKLLGAQIWVDALVQVFYQLSLALSGIVNLSSMKPKSQSIKKGVLMIPAAILICGLLSGINIFTYLGHFCQQENIAIEELKLQGIELSFNVFPKALALLPWPNLWLFIFFFSMIMLGIDSEFGFIQIIFCYLKDDFKHGGQLFGIDLSLEQIKYLTLGVIMVGAPSLTSQAGIFYLQFYDRFITNVPFTMGAVLELYFFVYVFKLAELETRIQEQTNTKTPWLIIWMLESKLLMGVLLLNFTLALINQISAFWLYPFRFYLLGWFISLYPWFIALFMYKKLISCAQMKLTFKELEQQKFNL